MFFVRSEEHFQMITFCYGRVLLVTYQLSSSAYVFHFIFRCLPCFPLNQQIDCEARQGHLTLVAMETRDQELGIIFSQSCLQREREKKKETERWELCKSRVLYVYQDSHFGYSKTMGKLYLK